MLSRKQKSGLCTNAANKTGLHFWVVCKENSQKCIYICLSERNNSRNAECTYTLSKYSSFVKIGQQITNTLLKALHAILRAFRASVTEYLSGL